MQINNPPEIPRLLATVATTAPLPTNTYENGSSGVGATITATANGVWTIDGYAINDGDYVLVKDEVAQANNGLYAVLNAGTSGSKTVLVRSSQMDTAGNFAGVVVPLGELGSTLANTMWICNAATPIVVGTTSLPFAQIAALSSGGVTQLVAGTNITLTPSGGTGAVTIDATSGGNPSGIYGGGSDGAVVATTGIVTEQVNATTYHVPAGVTVTLAGVSIRATQSITIDSGGAIVADGGAGTDGVGGGGRGLPVGDGNYNNNMADGADHGTGSPYQNNSTGATIVDAVTGGTGGNGVGGGGVGGFNGAFSGLGKQMGAVPGILNGTFSVGASGTVLPGAPGYGGGGGGDGTLLNGGGGGAGGGWVVLAAPVITNNGTISSVGGRGGDGDNTGGDECGGGGGGTGGTVATIGAFTGNNPVVTGGAGGAPAGAGTAGNDGDAGVWVKLIV